MGPNLRSFLREKPDGELYASGKALFVIPKSSSSLSKENDLEEGMAKLKQADRAYGSSE